MKEHAESKEKPGRIQTIDLPVFILTSWHSNHYVATTAQDWCS